MAYHEINISENYFACMQVVGQAEFLEETTELTKLSMIVGSDAKGYTLGKLRKKLIKERKRQR
jgi:hypothetical protein